MKINVFKRKVLDVILVMEAANIFVSLMFIVTTSADVVLASFCLKMENRAENWILVMSIMVAARTSVSTREAESSVSAMRDSVYFRI